MDVFATAVLAFAGGLATAGIAAWATVRGQRHDRRVEWRQRFDQALTFSVSAEPARWKRGGWRMMSVKVAPEIVLLARAYVAASERDRTPIDPSVRAVAELPLPEDAQRPAA